VEASASVLNGGRSILERSPLARLPDRALRWGLTGLAALILVILGYFFVRLIGQSKDALSQFGLNFLFGNDWDPAHSIFRAAPMLVGTLITSGIALVIGVPVAVAAAVFINELCPRRLKGVLAVILDLLAAVPSVVYGLWGVFVLIPKLMPVEKWFASTFSFIPWFGGGDVTGPNYFIAGLILAIMIVPIVSAIAREVIATVPAADKEAALALGATRWEMIRMAVLPYSRSGIVGGAMLGMGRALGETIAVVLVIGDAPVIGHHLFNQGYTLASVIASEFGEAANVHTYSSALFACGLVLFVLTLIVNVVARRFVVRGAGGRRGTGAAGLTLADASAEAG
jgi:phosphate ABC transporter permease protein PstC